MTPWSERTEHERGEHSGRQQVYNMLISRYLDERGSEKLTGEKRQRHLGRGDMIVWAAMMVWDLSEEDAIVRAGDDVDERWCARAD